MEMWNNEKRLFNAGLKNERDLILNNISRAPLCRNYYFR